MSDATATTADADSPDIDLFGPQPAPAPKRATSRFAFDSAAMPPTRAERAERWAEIKLAFESGTESAATLARRFGISKDAISMRARRYGWRRDGVEAAIAAEMHRRRHSTPAEDREVVERAAEIGVAVQRHHQRILADVHEIAAGLLIDMLAARTHRTELIDAIDRAATALAYGGASASRVAAFRAKGLAALDMKGQAVNLATIAGALKSIVELERQAHGLDDRTAAAADSEGDALDRLARELEAAFALPSRQK